MGSIRIDKLLWYLRFAKSRSVAQALACEGHIRLNGRRITRSADQVCAGDRLVLPLGRQVRVIELTSVPLRRGPAPEAQSCYRVLDEPPQIHIGAAPTAAAEKEDLQP